MPRRSSSPDHSRQLIVTVSDITDEILQQQKLAAIHQAGRELADLRPTEIFMMEVDERIDLLKENIRHYLSDLLNFEVIEIRLLEHATGNLVPLLSVGIDQDASDRQLFAHPQGNGITGYVAASGMSYVCQDVENDPLFIPGATNSKSSITAPLILHDQVLGTINVESPDPAAFHRQRFAVLGDLCPRCRLCAEHAWNCWLPKKRTRLSKVVMRFTVPWRCRSTRSSMTPST